MTENVCVCLCNMKSKCLHWVRGLQQIDHKPSQSNWTSVGWDVTSYSGWRFTTSQLDTSVGSIAVNMSHYPCGIFLTPCRVHALTNWGCSEGKRGCKLNISNVSNSGCLLYISTWCIVSNTWMEWNQTHEWNGIKHMNGMVSNTWMEWYQTHEWNVWYHSIHSIPAIIMSHPPLSSLHWSVVDIRYVLNSHS